MSIKVSALALKGEQFELKLAEVLTTWPLYREFIFYAKDDKDSLPADIDLFCPSCNQVETWQLVQPEPTGVRRNALSFGSIYIVYLCKRCEFGQIEYHVRWESPGEEQYMRFVKVGQYPALSTDPSKDLGLDRGDRELYKKALVCRNFDFGVGALSYLRRVVENRMNDLIDLIAEAAKMEGTFTEDLESELNAVKRETQFTKKIEYAAPILPEHLKPGGRNPLGRLHGLASEGIHAMPEDECIDLFDECAIVFEHLFIELRRELTRNQDFKNALDQLDKKRASRPNRIEGCE